MPRFAANLTTLFNEVAFLDRFERARACGFEAVEFLFPYDFAPAVIKAQLETHGLHLVQFNMPPGDWAAGDRGLAVDPRRVREFQDSVRQALAYACAVGTTQLHCMAGIVPDGLSHAEAHRTYLNNLKFAVSACALHGIRLMIEPINTFDMPGYFLNSSAQAADVIAEVGSPALFLQYDVYHMQRMEGRLEETLTALLPMIRHIQLADVPGRHEPGTGSGEIDWARLFAHIDQAGYTGWISCEYFPKGRTEDGLGWMGASR